MSAQTTEPTDGLDTPALVTAGLVSAVAVFAAIVALQTLYLYYEKQPSKADAAINAVTSSESLLAAQRAKLNRYGWLDREQGIVTIPIDRAIELLAREMKVQQESMSPSRDSDVRGIDVSQRSPAPREDRS